MSPSRIVESRHDTPLVVVHLSALGLVSGGANRLARLMSAGATKFLLRPIRPQRLAATGRPRLMLRALIASFSREVNKKPLEIKKKVPPLKTFFSDLPLRKRPGKVEPVHRGVMMFMRGQAGGRLVNPAGFIDAVGKGRTLGR